MEQIWILFQFVLLSSCLAKADNQEQTGSLRYDFVNNVIERLVKLEIARDEQSKKIDQLQEELEQLDNNEQRLKMAEKPTIAVKVRISKDFTLSVGQRLIYDIIVTNIGNAYNKERGSFRAPVDGIYLFSVTACSKNRDYGALEIVHDGKVIGQVRSGDNDFFDCNSEVTVARMETGSAVWVRFLHGSSGKQLAYYWNSFTAILIN